MNAWNINVSINYNEMLNTHLSQLILLSIDTYSSIVRWDYTLCHPLDESTLDESTIDKGTIDVSTLKVRFPVMTVLPFPSWPHFPFQHDDISPYPITRPTRPLQLSDPPPSSCQFHSRTSDPHFQYTVYTCPCYLHAHCGLIDKYICPPVQLINVSDQRSYLSHFT